MTSRYLEPSAELRARIDVAVIANSMSVSVDGATRFDFHLFAYLAYVAHCSKGNAPSSWGYPFAASRSGAPFADAVEYAVDNCVASGDLVLDDSVLRPSQRFVDRTVVAALGPTLGDRAKLVGDVCNLVIYRALPTFARAVNREPVFSRSQATASVRMIDDEAMVKVLKEFRSMQPTETAPQGPPSLAAMSWVDFWESK